MPTATSSLRQRITRETALFVGLLSAGLVLLPIAVWLVGGALFGEYGGAGYKGFFALLSGKIREGDGVAWFLVLSPYVSVSVIRLMAWGWRLSGKL